MSAVVNSPMVTDSDRLSLTVFFALVIHSILILGVGFTFEDRASNALDAIEVILVQNRSATEPERADRLAQVSQQGGGDTNERVRPSTPVPAPLPDNAPKLITHAAAPEPTPASSGNRTPEKFATEREARTQVHVDNRPVDPDTTPRSPREEQPVVSKRRDTARLEELSTAIASLDAEIQRDARTYAERPRAKVITATTKEYKYAAYMEAWRQKVERIGNLNYPDQARRQKLSGALVMSVTLNPDGSIRNIEVKASSGHQVLDDAAERIVRLSAPFAPFPDNIRSEVDVLHITRTWQFLSSGTLRSR